MKEYRPKRLPELNSLSQVDSNLIGYVMETADLLRNISGYYEKAGLPIKQKIVSSICARKLKLDGNECRTLEFNEVVEQIRKLGATSRRIKKDWLPIMEASLNR